MQVKKFEAKTMKEALQMVKQELGPEAIILSAKDNKKTFGLAGNGSIEITAAISEKSLAKKQYVENQIPEKDRMRFRTQSAKNQKDFIENTLTRKQMQRQRPLDPRLGTGAVAQQRPLTTRRYIDIADEDETKRQINGRRVEDVLAEVMLASKQMPALSADIRPTKNDEASLRKEVESLREMLSHFQHTEKTLGRHPGAEFGLPFEMSHSFEKLQEAGIDQAFIVEALESANKELTTVEKKKRSLVDGWVARYIMNNTRVVESWVNPGCQFHLFLGPSGQGKTTTLIKMAAQLSFNENKKVAVFSCDTFKVGASEQLKIYCQIMRLPFEAIRHSAEFSSVLNRYQDYDVLLVDYPGMALKDIHEIDQVRAFMPQGNIPSRRHLVLGCTLKDQDAYEACARYESLGYDDLIVTQVDEASAHGLIYNVQKKSKKPLYAFGVGRDIPEDVEQATRERVLDLIFKITKK